MEDLRMEFLDEMNLRGLVSRRARFSIVVILGLGLGHPPGGQLQAQPQGQQVAQKLSQNQQMLCAYSSGTQGAIQVPAQSVLEFQLQQPLSIELEDGA